MKNALLLGNFVGIKLKIHWTFSILIVWVIASGIQQGFTWQQTGFTLLFILSIFGCVVLHEFGHALMAKRYKINTHSITLLPIGGVASLEKIPENPKQELMVAFAGPAVNIVIASLLFPFVSMNIEQTALTQNLSVITPQNFLIGLFSVNLVLVVFNMIPAFPMDGGRVLRAILALRMSRERATNIAVSVGQVFAMLFILVGLFTNPFLILIAIFIYIGAQSEQFYVTSNALLKGFNVEDIVMKKFTSLHPKTPLSYAVKALLNDQDDQFVIENSNHQLVGVLTKTNIIKGLSQHGEEIEVEKVMNRNITAISSSTPINEVFDKLMKDKTEVLTVQHHGGLLGIIDMENLTEFIQVQNALKEYRIATKLN